MRAAEARGRERSERLSAPEARDYWLWLKWVLTEYNRDSKEGEVHLTYILYMLLYIVE